MNDFINRLKGQPEVSAGFTNMTLAEAIDYLDTLPFSGKDEDIEKFKSEVKAEFKKALKLYFGGQLRTSIRVLKTPTGHTNQKTIWSALNEIVRLKLLEHADTLELSEKAQEDLCDHSGQLEPVVKKMTNAITTIIDSENSS